MIPALSQVCSLPSTFAQDLEDYAAGHVPMMAGERGVVSWLAEHVVPLSSARTADHPALVLS